MPQSQQAGIFFPPADAKSLFDRLADCKAMESQLSACQQNYLDMKKERDLAAKAHRGSFWQRASVRLHEGVPAVVEQHRIL